MDEDSGSPQRYSPMPVAFPLTAEGEAQIRKAAQDALRRSFATLLEERVLPRSEYRPWIWMARDYFGHAVESEGPLCEALESALPKRFERHGFPVTDYPWGYSHALVEAAVAAATFAEEPYEVESPSVQATIDEFVQKVQDEPKSTVLRLVADVDVEHPAPPDGYRDRLGDAIEVADVRVMRVENQAERFIERELPSAGYEVERDQVVVFPGPASLLVATVASLDLDARVNEARRRVTNLISAIRLATGSTAHAVIDIAGDPSRIRWITPDITRLPSWGFIRLVHRPMTLSAEHVEGLGHLTSVIQGCANSGEWAGVGIALGRLNRSLDGQTTGLVDQAVDLAIGLEAALVGTDRTEIGLRLRTRAAEILATDDDSPDAIYRDVRVLYELRSPFVHGDVPSEKKISRAIRSISGTNRSDKPMEQYLLALDRWRDLLRRAILARIALRTASTPWSLGAKGRRALDIDEMLLRENDREAWRQHIRIFWTEQGLPEASNPPVAARLTIGRSHA